MARIRRRSLRRILSLAALLALLAVTGAWLPTGAQDGPFTWRTQMKERVTGVALSRDGALAALASRSGEVWLAKAGGEIVARWQAPNAVSAVAISGDGSRTAVVADNQQLYVLDGALQVLWNAPLQGAGISVALARDGSKVAAGTFDSILQTFDGSGQPLWDKRLEDRVYGLAFNEDASALLSGTRRGTVALWDATGAARWTAQADAGVRAVALSAGADRSAFGTETGQLVILDAAGQPVAQRALGDVPIRGVAMSADGSVVAGAVDDGQLYLLDARAEVTLQQALCGQLFSVALSSGGEQLAAGCDDGSAGTLTLAGARAAGAESARVRGWMTTGAVAVVVLAVLGGAYVLVATAPGRRQLLQVRKGLRRIWRHRVAYLLILPSLTLVIVFSYYPAYSAIIHAFTKWSPGLSSEFIGLANFQKAFADQYLWAGLGNLLIILLADGLKVTIMPLLVAELVFHLRQTRARYAYRMVYVLPMVVPGMVAILLWRMIYNPEIGLANQVLQLIGRPEWQRAWLGEARTALGSIIFMGFPWVGTIAFLIYYAGLMEISDETLDASRIDGAMGLRRVLSIDLPLIAPQLRLMLLLTYIGGMQNFQGILVMTGGGPGTATYVPALEMYFAAFRFGEFGYASAIATLLFMVILIITVFTRRQPRTGDEGRSI
jgi:ABC-type sugar transport system permease subunit/outer membrane protein assembly factor BamB